MEEAENIIIYLPNGEEGTLADFFDAVANGDIDFNDAGFIWYDGTIIETNGEPYLGMTIDDLYSLLDEYLEDEYIEDDIQNIDTPIMTESDDDGDLDIEINVSKDKVNFLYKLSAIGLLIYIAYNQN